jgi:hypothetical protein
MAKTWWPVLWFLASFMALGTGLLFHEFWPAAAGIWWSFWIGYTLTLPIMRWILRAPREARIGSEPRYSAEALRELRERYHVEE